MWYIHISWNIHWCHLNNEVWFCCYDWGCDSHQRCRKICLTQIFLQCYQHQQWKQNHISLCIHVHVYTSTKQQTCYVKWEHEREQQRQVVTWFFLWAEKSNVYFISFCIIHQEIFLIVATSNEYSLPYILANKSVCVEVGYCFVAYPLSWKLR